MIDEWINASDGITQTLYEGEKLYGQLIGIRPEGIDLIICPEHMGDTIWIAVFAGAYIQAHDCDGVYLVIKESQNEMVNHFPDIEGTVALTNDEMWCLRIYIAVGGLWDNNHIVFAHFHASLVYQSGAFRLMQSSNDSNMIEQGLNLLGIDGKCEPSRMLPLDDGNDEELKELFNDSVLFMPTAQSVRSIPMSFWIKLAARYEEAGYALYTNYNELPYEYIITGTKPLSSSIMELARIAPYFSQVISLRSGACDLIAETPANLAVLYNSEVPEKKVLLDPGDVKWDSFHYLVKSSEIQSYQYLPGMEDELMDVLMKQARKA